MRRNRRSFLKCLLTVSGALGLSKLPTVTEPQERPEPVFEVAFDRVEVSDGFALKVAGNLGQGTAHIDGHLVFVGQGQRRQHDG